MIRTEKSDVDSEKYIYKTDLKFADEFCQQMLDKVKTSTTNLIYRKNYDHALNNAWETYRTIGAEQSKELIRRGRQIQNKFPGQQHIKFDQYFLQPADAQHFLSLTPEFLKEIADGEPVPIFQISKDGDLLPAHKGHKRKSSLFMLLQGNSEETRWYRETEPFDVIPTTRIPDLDKIEHVVTARLEPGYWYVFNHLEWHSVHKFGSGVRMNIGLDFDSISAEELIEIIKRGSDKI
jgi:hypothetical protein